MGEEQQDAHAIVPRREKVVEFYGDGIPAAQSSDDEIYVALRPLATLLGLDPRGQQRRAENDPELSGSLKAVMMTGADGRQRELLSLPLEMIPGWLFGINPTRVKPELREKLSRYRREAFRVLWDAFKSDILPTVLQRSDLTPAQQMLQQAEAVYKLAQQQVELEQRYDTMAGYMRGFIHDTRQQFGQNEQRLNALELRLDPINTITEEQATALTLAVKNVAYALGGASSDYGKVYSELYRRYRVTTYKNLPRHRYDEALAWLGKWYEEVEGEKGNS